MNTLDILKNGDAALIKKFTDALTPFNSVGAIHYIESWGPLLVVFIDSQVTPARVLDAAGMVRSSDIEVESAQLWFAEFDIDEEDLSLALRFHDVSRETVREVFGC